MHAGPDAGIGAASPPAQELPWAESAGAPHKRGLPPKDSVDGPYAPESDGFYRSLKPPLDRYGSGTYQSPYSGLQPAYHLDELPFWCAGLGAVLLADPPYLLRSSLLLPLPDTPA